MSQIIDIFLLYVFVTLNLNSIIKVFLASLKTDFYIFAFFPKFLVTKAFNKYMVKCKIKFHFEVT
jgi:hypothetical protein